MLVCGRCANTAIYCWTVRTCLLLELHSPAPAGVTGPHSSAVGVHSKQQQSHSMVSFQCSCVLTNCCSSKRPTQLTARALLIQLQFKLILLVFYSLFYYGWWSDMCLWFTTSSALKEMFTQKGKFSHCLLSSTRMETWVKFHSPLNVSSLQRNNVAALTTTLQTSRWGL